MREALEVAGLGGWAETLAPLVETRLSPAAHGDYARWSNILAQLPDLSGDADDLREALLELAPWRKGPFDVAGVHIDAEWRSDWKWQRLADAIEPLAGRKVLDVGCGNGWYALKMREAGARFVLGIDPTLLYLMQFRAIQTLKDIHSPKKDTHTFAGDSHEICLLPLRLEELPPEPRVFDTTFSMGVLYHRRSPLDHLAELRGTLRTGGQLVLETIVLPGDDARASTPPGRYARMNNVWLLPTVPELMTWLEKTRFRDCRLVDVTLTTTEEQRATTWMSFESLAEALDPDDAGKTIEGWPAPRRAIITATAP